VDGGGEEAGEAMTGFSPNDTATVRAGVRVVLCAVQPLLRAGLRSVVAEQPDLRVAAEADTIRQARLAARAAPPCVVVVDVHLLDGCAAARAVDDLLLDSPASTRVVAIASLDDDQILRLLGAGASALLLAGDHGHQVVHAVRAAAAGQAFLSPVLTRRLLDRVVLTVARAPAVGGRAAGGGLEELTPREREIFSLVALGLSNAEIAARLSISDRTVKFHVSNLLSKLNLRDRLQAVVLATNLATDLG
jgi:DNA-binding NarL/FixJ family response regulator